MTTIAEILKQEELIEDSLAIYQANTYFVKLGNNATDTVASWWADTFIGGDSQLSLTMVNVGAVYVDGVEYTNYGYASNVPYSFYFDVENQLLYIALPTGSSPFTSDISIGYIYGFSDDDIEYIDDFPYRSLIANTITSEIEIDPLFLSKMSFLSETVSFDNTSGYFDDFVGRSLFGTEVRLFSYDGTTKTQIGTFTVEDETLSNAAYSVELQDKRKKLNIKIPSTVYTSDDFDDSDNDNIGTLIPEGYGAIKGIKCINIKNDDTSDYRFKFATDASAITTVYAYVDDAWTSVTPTLTDVENGTFDLSSSDCLDDNNDLLEIKADVVLRNIAGLYPSHIDSTISSPIDILWELFLRYIGSIRGIYVSAMIDLAPEIADIGFLMDEQKSLFEWIEKLQNAGDKNFMFFYDSLGKGKAKINDNDRTTSFDISGLQIISDEIECDRDNSEFATSVEILYDHDYTSGNDTSLIDNSEYDYTYEKYRTIQDLTGDDAIESLLTSETDAQSKATYLLEDLKDIHDVYTIDVKLSDFEDIEILDTVTAYLGYPPELTGYVESKELNSDYAASSVINIDYLGGSRINVTYAATTDIYTDGRELFGERTCKVIGITRNIKDNIMTLKLRSIE